jgi:hypothetical protein
MQRKSYIDRIRISTFGNNKTLFFTKNKLRIAKGYEKIIVEEKPFCVFLHKQICHENIAIPFKQNWREESEKSDYIEYRSKDYCNIKIKYDKKKLRFFVSLFDLSTEEIQILVEPLLRTKTLQRM